MQHLLPWFALKHIPGVGNHLFKKLIDRFGDPQHVFDASFEDLAAIHGIRRKVITAIKKRPCPDQCAQEIENAQKKGYHIICMNDPCYPQVLKEIPDPPPYMYVYGALPVDKPAIAIVGSRNATPYGLATAEKLAGDLSGFGMTVVSGMARGIDSAAHVGALKAGHPTVAVIGSGLDCIYPRENEKLFHQIAETGGVVSEFPISAKPEPYNFPLRNRIICGMSLGTVVVEAAQKSGSLITARLAAEQGREVFAVPGSIRSFKSAGTHRLLKQGAKLVENAQDVIDEFPYLPDIQVYGASEGSPRTIGKDETVSPSSLSDKEREVLEALTPYPVHIDELSGKLNIPPGVVSGILLKLELLGLITQAPGKYFFINEDCCGKTIDHR